MKTVTLSLILALTSAQTAFAVTSKDVFPGKEDGMVLKGEFVRKGTIKATIDNALRLNTLLTSKGGEQEILNDQRKLGRGLYVLDVFDMQPLEIWLRDPHKLGKIMVAVLTLQVCPELMTNSLRERLQELVGNSHPLLKEEIRKVL